MYLTCYVRLVGIKRIDRSFYMFNNILRLVLQEILLFSGKAAKRLMPN